MPAILAAAAALGRHIASDRSRARWCRRRSSIGTSSEKSLRQHAIERDLIARTDDEPASRAENTSAAIRPRGAAPAIRPDAAGSRSAGVRPVRRRSAARRARSASASAAPSRVELLLVPAVAEADQTDASPRRRTARSRSCAPAVVVTVDRVVVGRAAVAARATGSDTNLRNAPGVSGVVDGRRRPSTVTVRRGRSVGSKLRPPIINVPPRRRRAANPAVDRPCDGLAPVRVGDAGRFRRQRPAFADVPLGPIDAVPVHLVRPRAAEQHRIRQRPAERQRRRRAATRSMLVRSGSTTNQTGARPPPFQYFTASSHSCCGGAGSVRATAGIASPIHAIGRRRSSDSRRSIASTGATRSRRAADAHVVEQPERRRGDARVRGDRRAADVRAEHRERRRRPPARDPRARGAGPATARYAIGTTSGSA